jgi:putative PEP-CTERM system TPR-repeat lipoprotein
MRILSNKSKTLSFRFPLMVAGLTLLLMTGCGLAISVEDKLDRADEAYAEGDFRAAIIDSKDVLLKEPDNRRARLMLGRASLQVQDAASAEKELTRAIELGADLAEVAVELGRALVLLGQFDRVLEEITPDLASSGDERQPLLQLRGEALLGLNRSTEAREVFSTILESDENNVDAQLGVVSSYVSERNFMQARATLDQVIASSGDAIEPWIVSGNLFQARNVGLAETHFQRALELADEQEDRNAQGRALSGLGDAYLVKDDVESARAIADRMMEMSPGAPGAMYLASRIAYIDEDWVKAENLLQGVLQRIPNYRPAQLLLGSVHLQNGNLGQAEMYLSAVVAAAPNNNDARNLLAQTRLQQQDARAAQVLLQPNLDGPAPDAGSLALAAQASVSLGDFDQAVEYLKRAAEANPDNVTAQLNLATTLLMASRIDEAQAILDSVDFSGDDANSYRGDVLSLISLVRSGETATALEKATALKDQWPENARVLMMVGSLQMISDDVAAARESFEEAVKVAPNDILPIRFLAAAEERDGDFAAATKRNLEIIDLEPNNLAAIIGLARLSAGANDLEGARHWLDRALAADPQNFGVRKTLGQWMLAQRDFESAKSLAEETIEMANDNDDAHRLLGHAFLNLGEPAAAIDSFTRAISLNPTEPEYYMALARTQIAADDREAARDTIAAGHESNPGNLQLGLLYAQVKVNSGDIEAAQKIADELEKALPDNSAPLALQGELLLRSGKATEAAAKYEQALEIDDSPRLAARTFQVRKNAGLADATQPLTRHLEKNPLNTEIRTFLAQAYQVEGDNQSAISEYKTVLDIAPDNHIALNNLAWMYFVVDDPRAEETAKRAYEVAPDDAAVIDTLGWILLQKGELDDGVSLLRKAMATSSDNLDIRYHLAVGLAKQ